MFSQPQAEHQWLESLVGKWTFESECSVGSDQPPMKSEGTLVVESIGGLWVTCLGESPGEDGAVWKSLWTLGYDPAQQKYVGTFIAGMMTHLWLYAGEVDESGKRLILDTRGPRFDGSGMEDYQDVVEKVDDNNWVLWSQMRTGDSWTRFMECHYRRAE